MSGATPREGAPRPPRLTPQLVAAAAECPRRLWLRQYRADAAAPIAEHTQALRDRAGEHQRAVAARFPDREGPLWTRSGSFTDAAARTRALLASTRRPLQNPAFLSADGRRSSVPDFVVWDGDALVVMDVRLALRPETRGDFALHMAHHRALVRDTLGREPDRYVVVNGRGEDVALTPAPEAAWSAAVREAESTLAATDEPGLLRAHSACRDCGFYDHCWDRAEAERRIEILPEVSSAHVADYHRLGVRTIPQLAALDPAHVPSGPPEAVLRRAVVAARAWNDDRAEWLRTPGLPAGPLVWFDVEGDSRGEAAEIPIYLWGFALDTGEPRPRVETVMAELAPGGDARAWEAFVARAQGILAREPGVRWVHWDASEPLWLRRYTQRHGAPEGFLEAMLAACFDLKRVLDRSVRLPLRSYSIKHVARWMGFAWRDPGTSAEWSTAAFQRASASEDPAERAALLRAIADYNEDDLLAMRTIWRWLEAQAPKA